MGRTEVLQGLRMLKFRDALERWETASLSQLEAAELLGVGERTFRRWCVRYRAAGEAGLADRRLGRAAPNRVPEGVAAEVVALYRARYVGFTAKHFHEYLVRDHGYDLSYTWTKGVLYLHRVLPTPIRRGAHRRKRPRRPLPGMLLHQDASTHAWLPPSSPGGDAGLHDLVVTLDDATSAILSAILVAQEGTASSLAGLLEVFSAHGLPCSLYTDRGSHYFHTPTAGGRVDPMARTQVGRALAALHVEHIAAYSPQARGRSERVFRTLQDRLPRELALAGITTREAANVWLRAVYLPRHNARFAVAAEQAGAAWVAVEPAVLREALCVAEPRTVGNDNTVVLDRVRLQLPPSPLRAHYVRASVTVRRYGDGSHAVFHGPRCLARYDAAGRLLTGDVPQAA